LSTAASDHSSAAVAPRVAILGVRHHGPGSARSVLAALHRLDPEIVLVEGPPEAEPVLDLIDDPGMVPPVALLAYARDEPERAAFWPLAGFSPEWQAIRWARVHGRPVRFIDQPAARSLSAAPGYSTAAPPVDPIAELAAAAGYDDPERWWDDLVEHRGEDVFAAILEAMIAVRDGAAPATGTEAAREACMRAGIRRAGADGYGRIAVVCGAWHGPALVGALGRGGGSTPPRSAVSSRGAGKVVMTWVPWTSRRLAASSGYGAGVQSPGWYHHLFEHAGPDVVVEWFCEVAAVLREHDHTTSPAQVIDATRLADTLAVLRGRPLPGLSEVSDATAAVLGEGGAAPMALVHEQLVVGRQVGSVPDATPMVPVARDLAAWQRRLRMKPEDGDRVVELDLRRPLQLDRSRLLHRLTLLDIPWGAWTEGRGSAGTFRETWRLRWEPELAVRVVERSSFGTTVASAAEAFVVQQAREGAALADLTQAVEGCLLADLPGALAAVMEVVAERAAVHADVGQLMDALGPLSRSRRYGDVRGTDVGQLDAVIEGLVARIAAGLRRACTGLGADEATAMAGRLQAAQGAVALLGRSSQVVAWSEALIEILRAVNVPGLVRGRACRLLLDAERLPPDEAGRHLSRALTPGTTPAEGAAFVEGFLAGSGTVLLHDATLLGLLDDWLGRLPADAFTDNLPLLRRTFATFEPSERRLIGELVARDGGPAGAPVADPELDQQRVEAALATVAELLGIER
jgi:hypothetical protein